jgi:hypothetical protein
MAWKLPFAVLLGSIAAVGVGCAASSQNDPQSSSDESSDHETTHEGDQTASADELAFGDKNREGFVEPHFTADEKSAVLAKYSHVDPTDVVPQLLQENVLQYFDFNESRLQNTDYVTVIDMSIHSGTPRFFMIDMATGAVESTVVAHGEGSDPEDDGIPSTFSNVNNSLMTSLGYYKTAETYTGSWGFSLKYDGLSETNSLVRERVIVMHGASYVVRGKAKQGMSWGCTALPMAEKDAIIRKLQGGSLVYVDALPLAQARLEADAGLGEALDASAGD